MEFWKRCFYHFCRKLAIEKDLKLNFFPSKMKKFLLDITEGWLEFKKCSPYRFFSMAGQRWWLGPSVFDFNVQFQVEGNFKLFRGWVVWCLWRGCWKVVIEEYCVSWFVRSIGTLISIWLFYTFMELSIPFLAKWATFPIFSGFFDRSFTLTDYYYWYGTSTSTVYVYQCTGILYSQEGNTADITTDKT